MELIFIIIHSPYTLAPHRLPSSFISDNLLQGCSRPLLPRFSSPRPPSFPLSPNATALPANLLQ